MQNHGFIFGCPGRRPGVAGVLNNERVHHVHIAAKHGAIITKLRRHSSVPTFLDGGGGCGGQATGGVAAANEHR